MTVADLDVLRDQARGVLGGWARANAASRELGAALISSDGDLVDYAIYEEDAQGRYWRLASGNQVRTVDGSAIARASYEQILAQTVLDGGSWRSMQVWTPADRNFVPELRQESAYLISTEDGAATVLD